MFPKCVLRMQPSIRGGRKKKLRRNERVKSAVLERLTRWQEGQIDVLWSEACKAYPTSSTDSAGSRAANIRRATECAQDGRFGKAVSALLSLGMSAPSEAAVKEMQAKHPSAPAPKLPEMVELPDPVRFDIDIVRKKILDFPKDLPLERLQPAHNS